MYRRLSNGITANKPSLYGRPRPRDTVSKAPCSHFCSMTRGLKPNTRIFCACRRIVIKLLITYFEKRHSAEVGLKRPPRFNQVAHFGPDAHWLLLGTSGRIKRSRPGFWLPRTWTTMFFFQINIVDLEDAVLYVGFQPAPFAPALLFNCGGQIITNPNYHSAKSATYQFTPRRFRPR